MGSCQSHTEDSHQFCTLASSCNFTTVSSLRAPVPSDLDLFSFYELLGQCKIISVVHWQWVNTE
uniref:Uncharacterized protein n=1 Tax=Aegilops tauschii subsp. strangulata TaxID=200361 RepID=A0A453R1I7_AEGTS